MVSPVDLDLDLEMIEAYGINSTTNCIEGWVYQLYESAVRYGITKVWVPKSEYWPPHEEFKRK